MQIESSSGKTKVPYEPNLIKKCTSKDVLMGRGKRVSEWAGNKHFRQIVDRNRKEYVASERHAKARIAESVIQEIYSFGGRFIREVNGKNSCDGTDETAVWVVVEYDRALEKTCQALRERDTIPGEERGGKNVTKNNQINNNKAMKQQLNNTKKSSETTTKVRKNNSTQLLSVVAKIPNHQQHAISQAQKSKLLIYQKDVARKNHSVNCFNESSKLNHHEVFSKKRRHGNARKDNDKESKQSRQYDILEPDIETGILNKAIGNNQMYQPIGSSEQQYTMFSSYIQPPKDITQQNVLQQHLRKKHLLMDDDNEMIQKLQVFFTTYGHTAVPSCWSNDIMLADWCTSKRQLYREIQIGYRTLDDLTLTQQTTYKTLVAMNFCHDYDKWHWNYQLNEFTKQQQQHSKNNTFDEPSIMFKSTATSNDDSYLWLIDQERKNLINPIDKSRIKQLEGMGIIFH